VVAVSPLFGGKALKGPADRVLASHGFPPGSAGIAAAYDGLLDHLVVDLADKHDIAAHTTPGLRVHALDTRISQPEAGARFAGGLLEIVAAS
jgi:LPPG:FO 2-phospho-L-lactate transferase